MSSVETVSALERRLNASIPQQVIRGEVAAQLKKIGRTAKVSGFRPGKVPAKILEQRYGAQAHQEALGEVLQRSFAEAAQLNNLRVAGQPQFEIKTNDPNADPIEFSVTFEVYPEAEMGDLSGETLERQVYELTQEDVDNTIATLRKQRAVFEPVDRAAQAEDQVRVDFVGRLDGEIFQGGEAKDYPFVLGVGRMLPEFETAVTGMMAGETSSFDMTFPDDYQGKEVAGKQVTFTITLHRVEAPKLPEVGKEFAESIGITDGDVSRLQDEIRANLQHEVTSRLKARNKEAAMEALLKVALFDLPRSLVEWEARNLMQQAMHDMESRGMNVKEMRLPPEMFIERATKRIKLGMLSAELAGKHDLSPKPEQVRELVEIYSQRFDQPKEVVDFIYSDAAQLQEMQNLALEANVADWVAEQTQTQDKVVTFKELMGS